MGFLLSQDYPDFEIISLSDPYPSSLFLYTMSEEERFMAIIDSNLNFQWNVNSSYMGLDFKVNQEL